MRKKVALDVQDIRKPVAAQEVFRRMTEEILPYSTGKIDFTYISLISYTHRCIQMHENFSFVPTLTPQAIHIPSSLVGYMVVVFQWLLVLTS